MFFNEILGNLFEVPNVNLACEEFEFILSYVSNIYLFLCLSFGNFGCCYSVIIFIYI